MDRLTWTVYRDTYSVSMSATVRVLHIAVVVVVVVMVAAPANLNYLRYRGYRPEYRGRFVNFGEHHIRSRPIDYQRLLTDG